MKTLLANERRIRVFPGIGFVFYYYIMSTPPAQSPPLSRWILLPLRLFLGITFIYAGLQKLTDPQFFQPSAPGYIGKQIAGFATGSPIQGLLIHVAVPHASFFGGLVAYGEIAVGVGTMLGLLIRPAALFGMLISLVFFLSATWRVRPYFYGADIVFVFCWLTMLIAGPDNTGLPALDTILAQRFLTAKKQARWASLLSFFLGTRRQADALPTIDTTPNQSRPLPANRRPMQQQSRYIAAQRARDSRRNFLLGLLSGGAAMLGVVWFWNTIAGARTEGAVTPTATPANGTATTTGTPTTSGTPTISGTAIAQANAVKNNSAVSFTLASNGDPGILVRLNNGQFVCYDAVCTHAGCPVDYDSSSQLLVCPCHGAAFDPAKAAAVVQGPAPTPLTSVPIHVDSATGAITVSQ